MFSGASYNPAEQIKEGGNVEQVHAVHYPFRPEGKNEIRNFSFYLLDPDNNVLRDAEAATDEEGEEVEVVEGVPLDLHPRGY